jgi:hypothetical protein
VSQLLVKLYLEVNWLVSPVAKLTDACVYS